MASLLGAKMLFLIRLGWEANEIQFLSTRVDQSRLNFFSRHGLETRPRLGSEHDSVLLRIAGRLDLELVSQLETRASARFGL